MTTATAPARPSRDVVRAAAQQALAVAYSYLPGHMVSDRQHGAKRLRDGARNGALAAAAILRDAGLTYGDLPSDTRDAFTGLERIANGVDPRGGSIRSQARAAADRVADQLARSHAPSYL